MNIHVMWNTFSNRTCVEWNLGWNLFIRDNSTKMYHSIWFYTQNNKYSFEYIKKYLVTNIVIAKYLVYGNEKVNTLSSCSLRIQ